MDNRDTLVHCDTCKREERVVFLSCLRSGWPKCCGGHTMSLVDQPSPQVIDEAVRELSEHVIKP